MYETVEMLCNKLGVVADELIPQIVKLGTNTSICWAIVGLVLISMLALYHVWLVKKLRKIDWYDKTFVIGLGYFIAGLIAFVGLIVLVVNLCDIVLWVTSPTARAIQWIMNHVGAMA